MQKRLTISPNLLDNLEQSLQIESKKVKMGRNRKKYHPVLPIKHLNRKLWSVKGNTCLQNCDCYESGRLQFAEEREAHHPPTRPTETLNNQVSTWELLYSILRTARGLKPTPNNHIYSKLLAVVNIYSSFSLSVRYELERGENSHPRCWRKRFHIWIY